MRFTVDNTTIFIIRLAVDNSASQGLESKLGYKARSNQT